MGRTTIVPDALRRKIADAVDEGDYGEAVRLWAELVRQHPDDEGLRVEQIGALCRVHAWRDAEDCAARAVGDFPNSIYIRLAQANIAYLSFDLGVATDRFEKIRNDFSPLKFRDSLNTVLVQIHCCEIMADYESARRLAVAFWPLLRKASFAFRHESLLLGTLLPAEERSRYLAWIAGAVPKPFRRNFYRREKFANGASAWMRRRSRVRIVSLGQNCLPWMLPNRWGLRPDENDIDPISPFDYFPTVGDRLSEALDKDFEPLLRESALRPFVTGTKIPGLMNDAMQASFFHETGAWWSENDWARLKAAYRERIGKFKACVRQGGPALYVYALCGAASVEKVVASYDRVLHDDRSRLLIVNLLKDPVAAEIAHSHVRLVHVPYPEDYTWTHWEEYTSDRGIAFELEIVREILDEVRLLAGDERGEAPSDQLSVFETLRNALRVALR